MSFRRTSLGLRNQPVFFESDIVVYVEGRNLCEASVPQEREGDAVTQDSLFWNGILKKILPEVRLHFKALGSKTELIKLSSGLDEKVRGKVLICTDSDLDDLSPRTVKLNFVVPTYRYSWESDIWVWLSFVKVLGGLLPAVIPPSSVLQKARSHRDRFFRDSRKLVRLDVQTAGVHGSSYFLPRENPASIVDVSGKYPRINRKYLRGRARLYRSMLTRPWRPGVRHGVSCKRHFFGKAVDRFHCQLMVSIIRSMGLPSNVPFFVLQNSAIRELPSVLDDAARSAQLRHYQAFVLDAIK